MDIRIETFWPAWLTLSVDGARMFNWIQTRAFHYVHSNHLVYNTCWEDPRIDREALRLGSNEDVLVITSAGCNALDYILAGARSVTAVDVNPRQNALLELKIAACQALCYEDFFELFGRGRIENFQQVYDLKLRPLITLPARRFWDRHADYFAHNKGEGFYFHGSSGFFARLVNLYIDHIVKARDFVTAMLTAQNLESQQKMYYDYVRPRFWKRPLRWALDRHTTMALLGVPPTQRTFVETSYGGSVVAFIEECLDAVFGLLPLHDNYFYRVYLTGEYSPSCCPEYLRRENFALLRERCSRVTIFTGTVEQFLRAHDRTFSRYVLLDHMDWMHSAAPEALIREWQTIIARAAPQCRLIWRSGGEAINFVDALEVIVRGARTRLGELLSYDHELAARLHPLDRVHTYGGFAVADLCGVT